MDKEINISKVCRKLFFQTGKIGYYLLANQLEMEKEQDIEKE